MTESKPENLNRSSSERVDALVSRMMAYARSVKNLSDADANALAGAYQQAIKAIPEPLQALAVRKAVTGHKFGSVVLPGHLAESIGDEWRDLSDRQWQERQAAKSLPKPTGGFPGRTHAQCCRMAQDVLDGDLYARTRSSKLVAHGYLIRDGECFAPGPKMEPAHA